MIEERGKVKIESELDNKIVQYKLFSLGYNWPIVNGTVFKYIPMDKGIIMWVKTNNSFSGYMKMMVSYDGDKALEIYEESDLKEHTIENFY